MPNASVRPVRRCNRSAPSLTYRIDHAELSQPGSRLVFMSRSCEDTWVARQIAREISQRGAQPFLDEADVDVGAEFEEKIREFLDKADEVTIPRQSRGHSIVSRSKRLAGSLTRPLNWATSRWLTPETELIEPDVLLLLPLDVLADQRLVPADGRHKVPTRPEMLPHEVPLPLAVHPGQVDRALPLDEPDHLRHRVLRWNRDQHVHVIGQQVSFFDPTLLLGGQLPEHVPQVPPQLRIQRLAPVLRDEHHVILAVPD